MKRLLLAGFFALVSVSGASAQLKWSSPFLVPPRPSPGVGLYMIDADGGGVGALLTWQPTPASWGFRVGLVEQNRPGSGVGLLLGGDVSGAITRSSYEMPLDMDWVFGVGVGVADMTVVSVPLGITLGHTFRSQSASFTPYAIPRVIVDGWFGDDRDEALDLAFAVDLGIDLKLQSNWTIRFGGTLSDREAIAIGLVF